MGSAEPPVQSPGRTATGEGGKEECPASETQVPEHREERTTKGTNQKPQSYQSSTLASYVLCATSTTTRFPFAWHRCQIYLALCGAHHHQQLGTVGARGRATLADGDDCPTASSCQTSIDNVNIVVQISGSCEIIHWTGWTIHTP